MNTKDNIVKIPPVKDNFSVGSYTLINEEDFNTWDHWSQGLKMVITKNGVTIRLQGKEIEDLVKSLPLTFGGSY